MASPNNTFTELVSTTFRNHKQEIMDNLSNRNAFLKYMMKRGNYQKEDGGLTLTCPLDYAANNTYQRYSDWDTLNIGASDVISAAEYQWRQIALNVVSSGRELRINSGKNKITSLAKAKMKNALRTFNNSFSADLYSDGTTTNQINGLQAIISDDGTGTVGGIVSGTFTFWKSQFINATTESVTESATTIENSLMLPLWLNLSRGPDDEPDLIVMDTTYYKYFETSQVSLKRYASAESSQGGFVSLKYKNADVIYDNSDIPSTRAYFINTQYFNLCVHKDADLEVMDEQRPINQDGVVVPILWMGNITCSNRNQQGVIVDS